MATIQEVSVDLWGNLSSANKFVGNVTRAAVIEVLDAILRYKSVETAFGTVMLANNVAATYKNTKGIYPANQGKLTGTVLAAVNSVKTNISALMPTASLLINKAVAMPNVAGIPISSAKVETNKDVEVSESMVIVQSLATKKYWTDNAVPRLKEWVVTGYLTSTSPLDSGLVIKPSLSWQLRYLNLCADSRRPVLFKTSRGDFEKVQITNLHTVEEATYNNGVEISISLKEYNPYFISSSTGDNEEADLINIRSD